MSDKSDQNKLDALENVQRILDSIQRGTSLENIQKSIKVAIDLRKDTERDQKLLEALQKDPIRILRERGVPEDLVEDAALDITDSSRLIARDCTHTCAWTCSWTSFVE
jgi:hypothetical protein